MAEEGDLEQTVRSVWRELQDLGTESARLQTQLMREYVDTASSVIRSGGIRPRDVLAAARDEGQRYLREATRINVEYVRALQDLAAASGERFRESAESAQRRSAGGQQRARAPGAATRRKAPAGTATKKTARKAPAAAKGSARVRSTPRPPA